MINHLDFNASKCSVLTFSTKNDTENSIYLISQEILNYLDQIQDLGVIFNNFNYINHIIHDAHNLLGSWVRITKDIRNINSLKLLVFRIMKSKLE